MDPNQNSQIDLNSLLRILTQNPQVLNIPNNQAHIFTPPQPQNFSSLLQTQTTPFGSTSHYFSPPHPISQGAQDVGSNSEPPSPEFSTQQSTEFKEVASPAKGKRGARTGRKPRVATDTSSHRKVTHWSFRDNKLLATAYLNVGKDPIVGNNQQSAQFWGRIAHFFNENREADQPEREANACKQHWHTVNGACNKFHGCYLSFERRSGFNELHTRANARELFDQQNSGAFKWEHVWEIVKDEPKWLNEYERWSTSKRTKISAGGGYTSSSVDLDEEDCEVIRPMGTKAAKKLEAEKRKGKHVSNEQSEAIDKIADIERVRNDGAIEMAETKLICADVSKMTPIQRKVHEHKLKKLAAKYGWSLDEE